MADPTPSRRDYLSEQQAAAINPFRDKAEQDAPMVTPALVEHLREKFPHPFPNGATATTTDGQVDLAGMMAIYEGVCIVIQYLEALTER